MEFITDFFPGIKKCRYTKGYKVGDEGDPRYIYEDRDHNLEFVVYYDAETPNSGVEVQISTLRPWKELYDSYHNDIDIKSLSQAEDIVYDWIKRNYDIEDNDTTTALGDDIETIYEDLNWNNMPIPERGATYRYYANVDDYDMLELIKDNDLSYETFIERNSGKPIEIWFIKDKEDYNIATYVPSTNTLYTDNKEIFIQLNDNQVKINDIKTIDEDLVEAPKNVIEAIDDILKSEGYTVTVHDYYNKKVAIFAHKSNCFPDNFDDLPLQDQQDIISDLAEPTANKIDNYCDENNISDTYSFSPNYFKDLSVSLTILPVYVEDKYVPLEDIEMLDEELLKETVLEDCFLSSIVETTIKDNGFRISAITHSYDQTDFNIVKNNGSEEDITKLENALKELNSKYGNCIKWKIGMIFDPVGYILVDNHEVNVPVPDVDIIEEKFKLNEE